MMIQGSREGYQKIQKKCFANQGNSSLMSLRIVSVARKIRKIRSHKVTEAAVANHILKATMIIVKMLVIRLIRIASYWYV